jgi:hypothetical protein
MSIAQINGIKMGGVRLGEEPHRLLGSKNSQELRHRVNLEVGEGQGNGWLRDGTGGIGRESALGRALPD